MTPLYSPTKANGRLGEGLSPKHRSTHLNFVGLSSPASLNRTMIAPSASRERVQSQTRHSSWSTLATDRGWTNTNASKPVRRPRQSLDQPGSQSAIVFTVGLDSPGSHWLTSSWPSQWSPVSQVLKRSWTNPLSPLTIAQTARCCPSNSATINCPKGNSAPNTIKETTG